jgi:hypothetical protein
MAPRARFELATLRLTAEMIENLSALSGVAYEKLGAIFPSLVAPTPAPTPMAFRMEIGSHSDTLGYTQPCTQEVLANSSRHLKCYSYNTASDNFRVADDPEVKYRERVSSVKKRYDCPLLCKWRQLARNADIGSMREARRAGR